MSGPTILAYETNLYYNPYGLIYRVVLPHIELYIYIYIYIFGRRHLLLLRVSCSFRSNHQATAKIYGYKR